jgi:hypothetical protein
LRITSLSLFFLAPSLRFIFFSILRMQLHLFPCYLFRQLPQSHSAQIACSL